VSLMSVDMTNAKERDARLPDGRLSHDGHPFRAPIVFKASWRNAQGHAMTGRLRTNRVQKRWWYEDGYDESPSFCANRASTSSPRIAQGWADAMAVMSQTTAPQITKGKS